MVGLEPKLINNIITIKLDMTFDLERALNRVVETRSKPKHIKSEKMWFKLFDDLYSDRIKKGGQKEIIKILEEQINKR